MTNDFPRLMVATEYSPNSSGGGGAIIRQMLRDWPAEKLTWWSALPDTDRRFGRDVKAHSVAKIPAKLYPNRRARFQRSWLLEQFWSPWATRHLKRAIANLKPDVIWCVPHAWGIPPMAAVLPKCGIGFHVSMHDYMDTDIFTTRFGVARCGRLAAGADALYAAATTRDGICQAMLDDLRLRTSADGVVTRAGLEQADFEFLQNDFHEPSGETIRIGYAGSIQVEGVFHAFVSALNRIRSSLPRRVTIEFFGNNRYQDRPWFDASWMTVHGNLPVPELAAALKKCTWGFSPMDLTDNDPRYNRFSLPTKFISYLGAGLPIITMGHPQSSLMRLASGYETGVCLMSSDEATLAGQLQSALSETEPGKKFRAGILRCAGAEFNATAMRTRLYENFKKCAAKTGTDKRIKKV